jgi:hypothetical protein
MRAAMPKSAMVYDGAHFLTDDPVIFVNYIEEFVGHLRLSFFKACSGSKRM